MSDTTTQGIRVEVKTRYAPERSQPEARMHFFVYTITISNTGTEPAQLISRHWIITDATQHVEEVRGARLVSQPRDEGGDPGLGAQTDPRAFDSRQTSPSSCSG